MTPDRFNALTRRYKDLRIAVLGDFCLDRYMEIDPDLSERSIETGRTVHNVVRLRAQPGGAGTIVNNLSALGVGDIRIVGFCGDDGEGYELRRGLAATPGVNLDHFVTSAERCTFTYCKPLLVTPEGPPVELDRLDSKNWGRTPPALERRLANSLRELAPQMDALILLEQVDLEGTGALTEGVRSVAGEIALARPGLSVLADSRRGLRGWPPLNYKMNAGELAAMLGKEGPLSTEAAKAAATELARTAGRAVFVTLSERGIIGASPAGELDHVPSLALRGPIDIVGAGDAVTANLSASIAAGATLHEAVVLAVLASSWVIHQLGTTGAATLADLSRLLERVPATD